MPYIHYWQHNPDGTKSEFDGRKGGWQGRPGQPASRQLHKKTGDSYEALLHKKRSHEIRAADLQSVAADVTHFSTRIPINNAGEARAVVMFPCKFSQLPTVSFGFELYSTDSPGQMPVFAGSVDEWYTIDRLPASRLYVGARFLISSEAVEDISFVATATVSGIAFSGPVERR